MRVVQVSTGAEAGPLLTTTGDLLVRGAVNLERLPAGAVGTHLMGQGAGVVPAYTALPLLSGARALLSANQSIASGWWALVDLDVADWDIGGDFDLVNHWFVCPKTRIYMICCAAKVMNVTNGKALGCAIYVNGALAGGRVTFIIGGTSNPGAASSDMLSLTAGDRVQVAAFQNTGGNRDVQGGNIFTNYLCVYEMPQRG